MPILHVVVELSTNLELRKVWDHESFPHIEMVEKHDGYDTVYWQVLLCYSLAIVIIPFVSMINHEWVVHVQTITTTGDKLKHSPTTFTCFF